MLPVETLRIWASHHDRAQAHHVYEAASVTPKPTTRRETHYCTPASYWRIIAKASLRFRKVR